MIINQKCTTVASQTKLETEHTAAMNMTNKIVPYSTMAFMLKSSQQFLFEQS